MYTYIIRNIMHIKYWKHMICLKASYTYIHTYMQISIILCVKENKQIKHLFIIQFNKDLINI